MKFEDVLAFVKAGYSVADVKELLAIDVSRETSQPPVEPTEPQPPVEPTEPQPPVEPTEPQPPVEPTEPDYKKLYEESQKKVKQLQANNRNQNMNGHEQDSDDTIVADLFKSFM